MDGASGIRLANYMYSSAPSDGTVIATTLAGVPTANVFSPGAAIFDPQKFAWIGSATSDAYVGIVRRDTPIESLEDAKTTPVTMGGQSLGSFSTDLAVIANELFGFKFKIVTGYRGAQDVKLAIERGEIQGTFGAAWGSLKTDVPDWIEQRKVKIITQFGMTKNRELPDVPLFIDQARSEAERSMLTLLFAREDFSKPFFAPPDIPKARLEILRKAFAETIEDPRLIELAHKRNLEIDLRTGEEMADMVDKIAAIPLTTAQPIFGAFDRFRNDASPKQ